MSIKELTGEDLLNEMSFEAFEFIEARDQHADAEHTNDTLEHMLTWDEAGFTVSDEPFDLASEIMPSAFDKYLPNDGTSANERLLRKQGLRRAEDSTREEVQDLRVEVGLIQNRRIGRLHILRQKSGDYLIN